MFNDFEKKLNLARGGGTGHLKYGGCILFVSNLLIIHILRRLNIQLQQLGLQMLLREERSTICSMDL